MSKQYYTVKRVPGERPSQTRWQILGPGAPPEPIASEAIANMIRAHLERAASVLAGPTDTDEAAVELLRWYGSFDVEEGDDGLIYIAREYDQPMTKREFLACGGTLSEALFKALAKANGVEV